MRRALGREDNITKVELNDIVRKGAARTAADQRNDCIRAAKTSTQKERCQYELKRQLKKSLGRETDVSDVEAAEFARRGAADVTADYMSACVQRRKAADKTHEAASSPPRSRKPWLRLGQKTCQLFRRKRSTWSSNAVLRRKRSTLWQLAGRMRQQRQRSCAEQH